MRPADRYAAFGLPGYDRWKTTPPPEDDAALDAEDEAELEALDVWIDTSELAELEDAESAAKAHRSGT